MKTIFFVLFAAFLMVPISAFAKNSSDEGAYTVVVPNWQWIAVEGDDSVLNQHETLFSKNALERDFPNERKGCFLQKGSSLIPHYAWVSTVATLMVSYKNTSKSEDKFECPEIFQISFADFLRIAKAAKANES